MKQQLDENSRGDLDSRRLVLSVPVIKAFAVIVGACNLLLLIPDLLNLGTEPMGLVVSLRIGYALMAAALLIFIRKFRTFRRLAVTVTLMEAAAVAQFLLVFALYQSPNFMIQLLGMIVIVVSVFFVPNYWTLMLATALTGSAAFLAVAYGAFAQDAAVQLVPGMIYLGLVIVIGAVFACYSQRLQQREILRIAELEYASETDPLTKTGNRNMLGETGGKWFDNILRQGRMLSLVLMDVDNLKQFNDEHGHILGDALLLEIANITRSHLREDDICVRWGGDEFILLLPDTGLCAAEKAAERIRQAISAHQFEKEIQISCSFGIAALKPGQSLEALIKEADANMYHAKKGGKNAVAVSGVSDTLL